MSYLHDLPNGWALQFLEDFDHFACCILCWSFILYGTYFLGYQGLNGADDVPDGEDPDLCCLLQVCHAEDSPHCQANGGFYQRIF